MRSFVQQQDHYPFYAFPVLDVPPGTTTAPDSTTDLIPSHTPFAVVRRLGKANAQVKLPKLPIQLFVNGDWQARAGVSQFAYLDENTTPAVYVGGVNTTCGAQCHYQSEGDKSTQFDILGLIDDTHPTAAQLLDNSVVGDGLADH